MALVMRLKCITHADYGLSPELCLLWTAIVDCARQASTSMNKFQAYCQILAELKRSGLLQRLHEKILLDGREVQEVLHIKPGKIMQIILKRVEAWQFDRDISDTGRDQAKEECKQWLREEWESGGIVPIEERTGNGSSESNPKKKLKGVS